TIEVHVDVADGDVSIPDATAWQAAQARARDVARQQEEQRAAAIARFLAPLEAPRTDALPEWHRYLFEACGRLDPGAEEDYPATKVVPTRGAGGFERMAKYLGDAMIDEAGGDGLIMVASP